MLKRVLVAVVGIPALLCIFSAAPAWATMLLLSAICAVGVYELLNAVVSEALRGMILPVAVVVAVLIPICIGFDWQWLPLLAMCYVFLLFWKSIRHYGGERAIPFSDVTAAIFAGLVFPLMISCLLRLRLMQNGTVLVWVPLAISFGSDTFALFGGMLCGKHKLAPLVSPKKTVEGGIGGLLGGVIGLSLLHVVSALVTGKGFFTWWEIVIFGVVGSVVSQIGDLSFSVIKREFGVKDYGNLLPGHGGVLDRFDSVTFVAPFVWFIFSIL